jgi:hypothetical protein
MQEKRCETEAGRTETEVDRLLPERRKIQNKVIHPQPSFFA